MPLLLDAAPPDQLVGVVAGRLALAQVAKVMQHAVMALGTALLQMLIDPQHRKPASTCLPPTRRGENTQASPG